MCPDTTCMRFCNNHCAPRASPQSWPRQDESTEISVVAFATITACAVRKPLIFASPGTPDAGTSCLVLTAAPASSSLIMSAEISVCDCSACSVTWQTGRRRAADGKRRPVRHPELGRRHLRWQRRDDQVIPSWPGHPRRQSRAPR